MGVFRFGEMTSIDPIEDHRSLSLISQPFGQKIHIGQHGEAA